MSFDLPTLIASVALPAVIALLAATIAWRLDRKATAAGATAASTTAASATAGSETLSAAIASAPPSKMAATILATGWWMATVVAVAASEPLPFWSEDGWPKTVWTMLLSAVWFAPLGSSAVRSSALIWVAFGWLAVATGSLAMPVGDSWADMLPLHQFWIAAITIAATCNALALEAMAYRGALRWLPLVILAGLACPAISGAASYSVLFEVCVAAIIATTVIAVFAGLGLVRTGIAIVFPSVLLMATMVAASRFRSYADVPTSAYGIALFAPTLISLVDRLVADKSTGLRMVVAAAVGMAIVAVTTYQFLVS